MTALIVDDEPLARSELRRLLRAHPDVEILAETGESETAIHLVEVHRPQLLFLDVQMPGLTGFEVLENLECYVPRVIFTTAYDEYAILAFEVGAIDYLMKPIAQDRLASALSRCRSNLDGAAASARIFVRDGARCWMVRVSDIRLIESEGNYSRLHFGTERPLLRRSLVALEATLDPAMFLRANRRQIVNLDRVRAMRTAESGTVILTLADGNEVEMSRRRSEELKSRFKV